MGNVSQGAADVLGRQIPYVPGMVTSAAMGIPRLADYTNSYPQAADIWTQNITSAVAVGSPTVATIAGVVVTYLSTSADTTTTILAASFAAAVNRDPILKGILTASSAIAVVTYTGINPGAAFTVANGTNTDSATETQAAASANSVPFGVGLGFTTETSTTGPAQFATQLSSTLFTAQVVTLTAVYQAAQTYRVNVTVNELTYQVAVAADTNDNTTAAAITTALAAIDDLDDFVHATNSTNTIILTAVTAGTEFSVSVSVDITPATNLTMVATTGPSRATSAVRAFAGFSVYMDSYEQTAVGSGVTKINPNQNYQGLQFGIIAVPSTQTVVAGDRVYVELDNSSGLGGYPYNTAGTADTRVLLPRNVAVWFGDAAGWTGYAVGANELQVNVFPG